MQKSTISEGIDVNNVDKSCLQMFFQSILSFVTHK